MVAKKNCSRTFICVNKYMLKTFIGTETGIISDLLVSEAVNKLVNTSPWH